MQRTRVYDVYRPGQTMEESTWSRFKRAVSRGDKFVVEYKLTNGTSIWRTIQRLPAEVGEDATISRHDLTRRYADMKSLFVDGGMFDPTIRTHSDVWESDTWDEMHVQVDAIDSVSIYRWEPIARGGTHERSVIRNRTPAFFPFLVHEDVPYDLTHLQMYRARDPRPESEQSCMIHSILEAGRDLKITIDEKVMASVILRYVKGGIGNTSTVHLTNIARALGVRFRLTRQVKSGKRGDSNAVKDLTEYRPNTPDVAGWPVIPLALHRGHIFYNKILPACSAHTVITVDCKNNPALAASRGLLPRTKNKPSRLPREEIHDSLWLIHQLEKFRYISEIVDPRVIIDRIDHSVKLADRATRVEVKERCDRISFDNIAWVEGCTPVSLSIKNPRTPKPDTKRVEGSTKKEPTVCSFDFNAQKRKPGWRVKSDDTYDPNPKGASKKKPPASPLSDRLKVIDQQHTYFWAADTEAATKDGPVHQLYLWGAAQLSPSILQEPAEDIYVDIQTDVSSGLVHIAECYSQDIKRFYREQEAHMRRRKCERHINEWQIFKARLHSSSSQLDTIHLVKVVIYIHNLRYDRALIEPHVLVFDVLQRDTTVYEMKVKHPNYPEILFVFRDSSKHLTNMSVAQMTKKMGLPARLNKKSTAIYYDHFKLSTRGRCVSVGEYIASRPDKAQPVDAALLAVNDMLRQYFLDSKQPGAFEPLGLESLFCPDVIYRWYLKYDVLVLIAALLSYESALEAVSSNHLSVHAAFRPLHYPTISSYSRALLTSAGAFDECVKYSLGLRAYIQRAVRGGRTSAHRDFEGKVVSFPGGIDDMDGVSLYPSAIASLPGFPIGMPRPIPETNLSLSDITREAHTAVVTVRITAIKRRVHYMQPIIAYKDDDGTMSFIQELPHDRPFVDTLHLIDLEEYIRIHDIDYEILYGIWWHKRPHVLYSTSDGEGGTIQFWDQAEKEEPLNREWPAFALKLHEARKAAKEMHEETGDIQYKVQADMLKLIANSGYGGTVLRISDTEINVRVRDPSPAEDLDGENTNSVTRTETYLFNNHGSIHDFRETPHNVFITQHQLDYGSSYNIFGVMILAQSRRNLNRVLESYEACGAYHVYGDTDSVHGPKALTVDIARHYDAHRDPSYPPLIGKELLQFHVDFATSDFTIYPDGLLENAVSVWPREAKECDIYSSKLILVRKKVYLHMLSVDYKTTCPTSGETISKRAFGMTVRCKGVTQRGLFHQAYLLGKTYLDGEANDPFADEDTDYCDPTSRGLLSIFKQVIAGNVISINLLTDRGDVRFYFSRGSVTTSAAPCTRTLQLSEAVIKRGRGEDPIEQIPKRICVDMDEMDDEEISSPPSTPTTFICIDMDDY